MDTETLVENWGTTYSDHKRVGLGSFSPSQLSEKLDENWGTESPYESLPFSQDDAGDYKTETPHEHASNFVKVDQLPSGASVDDVKSSRRRRV